MQAASSQLSAKEQEIAELDAMLEETQGESESHQAALRDCQDMLEELQTFSQGRETRLQALQQEVQVGLQRLFCDTGLDCVTPKCQKVQINLYHQLPG